MTIVGQVNYSYQIMADGQIYEVANTSMGDDLVMNYISEKVEVTGTVEKKEDAPFELTFCRVCEI